MTDVGTQIPLRVVSARPERSEGAPPIWRTQVYCGGTLAWAFIRQTGWVCSCGKPLPWLKGAV